MWTPATSGRARWPPSATSGSRCPTAGGDQWPGSRALAPNQPLSAEVPRGGRVPPVLRQVADRGLQVGDLSPPLAEVVEVDGHVRRGAVSPRVQQAEGDGPVALHVLPDVVLQPSEVLCAVLGEAGGLERYLRGMADRRRPGLFRRGPGVGLGGPARRDRVGVRLRVKLHKTE